MARFLVNMPATLAFEVDALDAEDARRKAEAWQNAAHRFDYLAEVETTDEGDPETPDVGPALVHVDRGVIEVTE